MGQRVRHQPRFDRRRVAARVQRGARRPVRRSARPRPTVRGGREPERGARARAATRGRAAGRSRAPAPRARPGPRLDHPSAVQPGVARQLPAAAAGPAGGGAVTRRALALLLALALCATGCGAFGDGGAYTVTAELSRSYNLFPGSPVRVLGVDVGQITDLEVPAGTDRVQVTMRIDGAVDVPGDASATVIPESLLGERYVQLPAYTDGPRMEDGGVIPLERTQVPFEFDEVLEGLNQFVGGLDEDEVARLVSNLAETLDGQGAQLGRTIDQATEAIGVLRDNDDELIALASRLADLNTTLNQRDQELAALLQDFDTLTGSLVADGDNLDAALVGLVRLTQQLGGLLGENRERLEDDIEVLTRVGRTAQRNLDNVSLAVLGSAELFRHAERIIDRERNFLPLQDQLLPLVPVLTESIFFRIEGICLQAGLSPDLCSLTLIEDLVGGLICAPPLFPCPPGFGAVPLEEALQNLVTGVPELGEALLDQLTRNATEADARANTTAPEPGPEPASRPEPAPAPAPEPAPEPDPRDEASNAVNDLLDGLFGGGR
ncbi:MCE family protein [Nitriliruptoraceae bacterium ZYF776]|nr:MCE family protein [Profundirhabdus halotolerans]